MTLTPDDLHELLMTLSNEDDFELPKLDEKDFENLDNILEGPNKLSTNERIAVNQVSEIIKNNLEHHFQPYSVELAMCMKIDIEEFARSQDNPCTVAMYKHSRSEGICLLSYPQNSVKEEKEYMNSFTTICETIFSELIEGTNLSTKDSFVFESIFTDPPKINLSTEPKTCVGLCFTIYSESTNPYSFEVVLSSTLLKQI
ncbi:hypothetical protein MJH12_13710 [bacterium]|nr:hypothetical protein [bacterium]